MIVRNIIKLDKLLSCGCVLFSFVGCAPTMEHSQSSLNIPQQWRHTPSFHVNNATILPELAWWKQFSDPQLNDLMQKALENNNDLQIAQANLEHAQNQLKQVQLNWIPGMNILAGYSQMPNLGDPGYFWGLFPLYTLNIFQQMKNQEAAKYHVAASRYAQDSVRLTVIGQVAASYFTVLAQKEALDLYQQLLNEQKKQLSIYEKQHRLGLISQDLLDNSYRDIQTTQAQTAIISHNIRVAENALRFLMNQNPDNGNGNGNVAFSQINSQKIIPGNYPVTVLYHRPDVQQAKAALDAASAGVGAAVANLLPSVRLDSMLGNSTLDGTLNLNEAYFSVPVFSPQTLGSIKVSESQVKILYATYIKIIRQVLRDVDNDLSAYSAYSQQLESTKQALIQENKRCMSIHSRYQYGIDSAVEVTHCQIQQDKWRLIVNQKKLGKMMTIVALYQDLAGGYHAEY